MDITIKKIAEIAGVSRGTVDRALNGRPGVKKEVAEKVISIADELGYKPNIIAKALAEKKPYNKKIGAILNADNNPFYIDVIKGVRDKEKEIKDFGFEVLLETTKGYDIGKQLALIDEVADSNIGGMILSPIDDIKIADKINLLAGRNIPVLTINTDIHYANKLCYVGSNYYEAGNTAAGLFGLLSGRKKQKIAIITGSNLVLGHNLRVNGFVDCAKREFKNIEIVDIVENNDNDIISYKVTLDVLRSHPDISGLFFCAAGIEGGLIAVGETGLLKKINIVAVDLTEIVKENIKNENIIATICQEPYKQGFESVKIMFDYIVAGKMPSSDIIYTETQVKLKYNI